MGRGTYVSAEVHEDEEIKSFISDKLLQRVEKDINEGKASIPSLQMALRRDWSGVFKNIFEPAKKADNDLQEQLKRLKTYARDAKQLA
jgi:hypothetical protein